ncbi:TolC family protein, partial [Undibacterium luofuense]
MLGFSLPLYDGGTRQLSLSKARLDAENAGLRAQQLRDEAVRQILQTRNSLIKSIHAWLAAQVLVDAAQTTYNAA